MSFIEDPLLDTDKLAKYIARELRVEIEKRDLTMKEVVNKAGMSQSTFSNMMGSKPSNNGALYRKIARAIWLTDARFDEIVAEAKIEDARNTSPGAFDKAVVAFSRKSWDLDAAYEVAMREVERIRKLRGH